MNIPLDNLYHFIDNQFNGSALIYRFYPHGAKNQANLWPLEDLEPYDTIIRPVVICHDQEPLQFNHYNFLSQQEYVNKHFDPIIHDYIKDCNLDFDTWANIHQKKVLLHSEINSIELKKYQESGIYETAYYWSHALIAHDWYRYAQIDPQLAFSKRSFDYTFNVYCRAWTGSRKYRIDFLEKLANSRAVDHTRIRFSTKDNNEHYTPTFNYVENTASSSSSASYDSNDVRTSLFDVVLETVTDRIMLTEKILRPIACGQPFVLMAAPGSLKLLKSYGFITFSKWIDESYDDIEDDQERMTAIVSAMEQFDQALLDNPKSILTIAAYNKEHFFSDHFFKRVITELNQNLLEAGNRAFKRKTLAEFNEQQLALPVSTHDPVTVQDAVNLCTNTIPTNPMRWSR